MNSFKELCKKIVESQVFNNFIIIVIVLNAVVIGLETYPFASEYYPLFNSIHFVVIAIFSIEVIVKLVAVSPNYGKYFGDKWNLFDFLIVTISIVPMVGPFVTVARIARLLRVLRLITKFEDLKIVVSSLINSIPSVISVLLLMFLIFYIYAIFGTHFFGAGDPEHWGSLGKSLLSLFTMVTLEGWDRLLYIGLGINPLAWVYFVSFIIIGALMIVNLFVGIILYNITQAKQDANLNDSESRFDRSLYEIKEKLANIDSKIDSLKGKNHD